MLSRSALAELELPPLEDNGVGVVASEGPHTPRTRFLLIRQIYPRALLLIRPLGSIFHFRLLPFPFPYHVALFEMYRVGILFALPSFYQSKLSSLLNTSSSQSANILSAIADDPVFSNDWKNIGSICGIQLS